MNDVQQPVFATTRWTVVLRAAHDDSPEATAALAEVAAVIGIRFTPMCAGRDSIRTPRRT